jgi:hypothetical protein
MMITIDVEKYYDWEPMEGEPSAEDRLALKAKVGQDGKWLKKVVKENQSYTQVNLPDQEIDYCMAHFERIGSPKSREKVVAWYLEEKVMPHHAHPDHFMKVTVHDEPEVEAFLNKYFCE